MIEIKNLTKVFTSNGNKIVALDDVSLTIKKGEIYGIIGLSGAGKSTLIRCINMLEKPDQGQIFIGGKEITALSGRQLRKERSKIGMIFQHFNLLSSRTVAGNVAFPLEIAGTPKAQIKERVNELLYLVGLADKANMYPAQLSGGQKQRVGIARALANNPEVLLCDEATSALDPQTTKSILALLQDINKRLGLTIVLITHEMEVVKEICDSVAVIDNGKIVENGPLVNVFAHPRTEAARRFIKGVIQIDLPEEVKEYHLRQVDDSKSAVIARLSFIGTSAGEPVVSSLVRHFDVDANILAGNIDHLKDVPFGTLVVELRAKNGGLDKALKYLAERGIEIEVFNDEPTSA
ncbi:MAG: methionine ABC transporter ATP-binding protein [Firmicutes bacterium]|nr:methionine ABC transporter ATP-binding protein [Bacillota bacterium]